VAGHLATAGLGRVSRLEPPQLAADGIADLITRIFDLLGQMREIERAVPALFREEAERCGLLPGPLIKIVGVEVFPAGRDGEGST
jgi:hypothetical protein